MFCEKCKEGGNVAAYVRISYSMKPNEFISAKEK